jgi:hypothetical protein
MLPIRGVARTAAKLKKSFFPVNGKLIFNITPLKEISI